MTDKSDPKKEFRDIVYQIDEDYQDNRTSLISPRFGLCATCTYFEYVLYTHGNEKISCDCSDAMRHWPSGIDAVKHCAKYSQKGGLSLQEMGEMATYIEAKKNKVGF